MLRPVAVQTALVTLLETPSVPADTALVVFSDSGTIYAQASISQRHQQTPSPIASTSSLAPFKFQAKNESQRLQRTRQPGLSSLLGNPRQSSRTSTEKESTAAAVLAGKGSQSRSHMMELQMEADERAKILAALACQSWTEETNRVKRLFTKLHGHSVGASTSEAGGLIRSYSSSTGGGNNGGSSAHGNGKGPSRLRRIEQNSLFTSVKEKLEEDQDDEGDVGQESVAAPVAVPGTLLNIEPMGQGAAPLLLEGHVSIDQET
jgi:hypothetical protein